MPIDSSEFKRSEFAQEVMDSQSLASEDEGPQNGQVTTQEYARNSYQEIRIFESDNVRYELHGVCHGPGPVRWRRSHRRAKITTEADATHKYPDSIVFVEQKLLSCQKAIMLEDIQYAVDNFKSLRISGYARNEDISKQGKQQANFQSRTKPCYMATPEAIALPQPFGMESNLSYIESYLATFGKNDPNALYLYVGLTPSRPAYIAKRLQKAAEHRKVKRIRLYCGIAHVDEVLFLLENPDYIDKYLCPLNKAISA